MQTEKLERVVKNGERYVMVPETLFDDLLEDADMAEEIARCEAVSRAIAAGKMECFPASFGKKLSEAKHKGGNRIGLWRDYRGMTREVLGRAAGVSGQYIGMIEAGRRTGSARTLKNIAGALAVDMDDIL